MTSSLSFAASPAKICFHYARNGFCRFGYHCRYRHIRIFEPVAANSITTATATTDQKFPAKIDLSLDSGIGMMNAPQPQQQRQRGTADGVITNARKHNNHKRPQYSQHQQSQHPMLGHYYSSPLHSHQQSNNYYNHYNFNNHNHNLYHQQYRHRHSSKDSHGMPFIDKPYNHINDYFNDNFQVSPNNARNNNNNNNNNINNDDGAVRADEHRLSRRQSRMANYFDKRLPILIFDIDGTLADIQKRLSLAPGSRSDGSRTASEWNVVLNGNEYVRDEVIPPSLAYLRHIAKGKQYNILYLSGRRTASIRQTYEWLFKVHEFPAGFVIHRHKGIDSISFKVREIRKLQDLNYRIVGYFGDRILDDTLCCLRTGVKPILVIQNEWLYAQNIVGGLAHVIPYILQENERLRNEYKANNNLRAVCELDRNNVVSDDLLRELQRSPFYHESYLDVIPLEFCNEMFVKQHEKEQELQMQQNHDEEQEQGQPQHHENAMQQLLPPAVWKKCLRNPNYWMDIAQIFDAEFYPALKKADTTDTTGTTQKMDSR